MNAYEIRWQILQTALEITREQWKVKTDITTINAEKNGISIPIPSDIDIDAALALGHKLYNEFVAPDKK